MKRVPRLDFLTFLTGEQVLIHDLLQIFILEMEQFLLKNRHSIHRLRKKMQFIDQGKIPVKAANGKRVSGVNIAKNVTFSIPVYSVKCPIHNTDKVLFTQH